MKSSLNQKTQKTFNYHAKNTKGKLIKGKIDAQNMLIAKSMLKKQGLHDVRLKQNIGLPRLDFGIFNQVKLVHLSLFYRHLTTLLSAGIALTQSLQICAQNCQNSQLKAVILDIKTQVQTGTTLAKSCAKHPKIFDSLSIALIHAGEESGQLEQMLARISTHHEKAQTIKNKLSKAAKYPIAVIITAVIVTAIMLIKVVPAFAKMFASFGDQLPLPTRMVMSMSDFVVSYFWWLFVIFGVLVGGFFWLKKHSPQFTAYLSKLSLKIAIVRDLTKSTAYARFARTLGMTLGAGMPLLHAVDLSAKSTNHNVFMQACVRIVHQLGAGSRLYDAMEHTKLFSPMLLQMVQVGEESGKLSHMLEKIADYYDEQIDDQVDALTSMIEPIIIVLLGLIIGGLVLAMYLPMIQMGAGV